MGVVSGYQWVWITCDLHGQYGMSSSYDVWRRRRRRRMEEGRVEEGGRAVGE